MACTLTILNVLISCVTWRSLLKQIVKTMTSMSWLTRGGWSTSAIARTMNASQNFLSSQNFSLRFRHITLTLNECFHLCKASGQRNETSCMLNPWKEFFLYNTISSICHAVTFTHTCAVNRNCLKQFVLRTSILSLSLWLSQVQAKLCLRVKMKQVTDGCSVLMCLQYCYVTTSNGVVNYQDIVNVMFCAYCEYSKTCKPVCVICIWFCIGSILNRP